MKADRTYMLGNLGGFLRSSEVLLDAVLSCSESMQEHMHLTVLTPEEIKKINEVKELLNNVQHRN